MDSRKAVARGGLFSSRQAQHIKKEIVLMAGNANIQSVSKKLSAITTICITVVLLCAIGSWVYVQKQNLDQKNRALIQQKALDQYNQAQLNARNKANIKAVCEDQSTASDPFKTLFC